MNEKNYYISEAARLVGVEAHVLRYWEEQLELPIKRNEMGHRYYEEEDIWLMSNIRQVVEKGVQLRAVKMMLPGLRECREDAFRELMGGAPADPADEPTHHPHEMPERPVVEMPERQVVEMPDASRELRMMQFQEIMSGLIGQALQKNNTELAATTSELVSERLIKEMDYLMRLRETQEEERYKKLDETIRTLQKSRKKHAIRKKKS